LPTGAEVKLNFNFDEYQRSLRSNEQNNRNFSVTLKYSAYLSQNHTQYYSNSNNNHNSGAYIFRTSKNHRNGPGQYSNFTTRGISICQGELFTEIFIFGSKIDLIVRFNNAQNSEIRKFQPESLSFELESLIRPIGTDDGYGKEVIMELTHSEIFNNQKFYTDSNGLGSIRRRANKPKPKNQK
jgi:hypothetical protein